MSDAAMNDAPAAAASASATAAAAAAAPTAAGSSKSERKRKRDGDIDIAAESGVAQATATATTAATAAAPASSTGAAASASAASPAPLLLTTRGGEAIRQALATQHPTPFIQQFQAEHGIRAPSLESSLSFLDLFVSKRSGIYSTLLHELNEKLTDKIRTGAVEKERIPVLLESSFAYIAVDELRSIPIALLMSLLSSSGSIPSKYLKVLLSSPSKLQESLPLPLRRALMESDPSRLFWNQAYWQALLAAYANDSGRIESYNTVWPLEPMVSACRKVRKDGNGPVSSSSSNAAAVSPSAQALRGMLEWIGSSVKLYDYTCAQLRELVMSAERTGRFSEAQMWRSMRVDLIMRLHETDQEAKHHHHASSAAAATGVTAASASSASSSHSPHRSSHLASHIDHLHTWVWCLDAGSRDSGQLNQKLVEKLLGGESSPGLLATIKPKHVGRHCFAELSMLASHPAIVLTLLQSIVTALSQSVEKEITPKEHAQIKPLTNMLHLALSPVQSLLRADAPVPPLVLPEPSNIEVLLTEFYPFVAELIIYAQLGEMEPLNPKLLDHVESSPVSRYVFLFYLLSRLQAQDVLQSSALLACLPNIRVPASAAGSVGESLWSVESSQGDQQLLNGMLQTAASLIIGIKHVLKTDAAFRTAVFPSCFLLLARASCFAHKQCLRLLLACVDCLTVEESASFLAQLQREGRRADAASPDEAAVAAASAATTTTEAPAVTAPTPLSQLPSQIASVWALAQLSPPRRRVPLLISPSLCCSALLSSSLYQQFQASHPQLFKAAAAKKS